MDSTSYVMIVCTYLGDDRDTTNDCAQKTIFAYDLIGIQETLPTFDTRPLTIRLLQNKPNPFSGRTVISYSLPSASHVTLDVYDLSGRLVRTLVNETKKAGIHRVALQADQKVAGVYFYRLRAGDFESARKMVVIDLAEAPLASDSAASLTGSEGLSACPSLPWPREGDLLVLLPSPEPSHPASTGSASASPTPREVLLPDNI